MNSTMICIGFHAKGYLSMMPYRPQTAAALAKTRGQDRPKRQLKQPDKYDPDKQAGRQAGRASRLRMPLPVMQLRC